MPNKQTTAKKNHDIASMEAWSEFQFHNETLQYIQATPIVSSSWNLSVYIEGFALSVWRIARHTSWFSAPIERSNSNVAKIAVVLLVIEISVKSKMRSSNTRKQIEISMSLWRTSSGLCQRQFGTCEITTARRCFWFRTQRTWRCASHLLIAHSHTIKVKFLQNGCRNCVARIYICILIINCFR